MINLVDLGRPATRFAALPLVGELPAPDLRRRGLERVAFGLTQVASAIACALVLPAGHGLSAVAIAAALLFVAGTGFHLRLTIGMVSCQQAAFVLLAFTVPLNLLPAATLLLTLASLRDGPLWTRVLVAGMNSWYAVIGAALLALLAPGSATWGRWPQYAVAFGGALVAATAIYYLRSLIRHHDFQLREELAVLGVDITLTPIGLAAATDVRSAPGGAVTLMLSATALLALVGREHVRRHAETERALSDPLTGLGNRAHFDQAGAACLSRCLRSGQDGALLLIDLDNFKLVNDTHGHQAGDVALQFFADALRESTRAGDTAARIGGDEFAVILAEPIDEAGASQAAEALRRRLSRPLALDGGKLVNVEFALGHALFGTSCTLDQAFARADDALYADKRAHKSGGAIRY